MPPKYEVEKCWNCVQKYGGMGLASNGVYLYMKMKGNFVPKKKGNGYKQLVDLVTNAND